MQVQVPNHLELKQVCLLSGRCRQRQCENVDSCNKGCKQCTNLTTLLFLPNSRCEHPE